MGASREGNVWTTASSTARSPLRSRSPSRIRPNLGADGSALIFPRVFAMAFLEPGSSADRAAAARSELESTLGVSTPRSSDGRRAGST